MNFIALDVETAIGKRWSICQLGIVVIEDNDIIERASWLVQPPGNEYHYVNSNIHGITPDMTINEPTFDSLWPQILPYLNGNTVVAHNAVFDSSCLYQTLEYYGIGKPKIDFECTLKLSGMKLSSACHAFGIELTNHHNALADAEACANLYMKINDNIQPNPSSFKAATKKNIWIASGHERIKGQLLKPDLEHGDPNSPFYGKKVVFTGVLKSFDRNKAAEIVKKLGADIDTSITKRTHFVITGSAPGPSKMAKIQKLRESGYDIQLITDQQFKDMLY